MVDVREIMDINMEDFKESREVTQAINYMNQVRPIAPEQYDIIPTSMSNTMTFSNSKLNSYLKKSNLDDAANLMENRHTAIMYNRTTNFDTLQLPQYILNQIKAER